MFTGLATPFHPPTTFLDNVANVELVIGMLLMILFTVAYGVFFNFKKTPAGKSLFWFFLSISILLIYSTVTRIVTTGDYPLRDVFRVVVYAGLPGTMIWLFVTLVRNWLAGGSLVEALPEPRKSHTTGEIPIQSSDSVES